MPYLHSGNKEAVGENIRTWRNEGYPEKQAVAMALSTQRKYKKKGKGKSTGKAHTHRRSTDGTDKNYHETLG